MKPDVFIFIHFMAGITFAMAAVNLIIGLRKGSDKTYLFLGLIGVCAGIYYLLFPHMTFIEPLSIETKTGFFFFLANFALLPWFFCHYTSYCKNKIQWLLTVGMNISYLLLLFTNNFDKPAIWNIFAHVVLVGIIIFGFKAAIFQRKKGELLSANLLLGSLGVFSILTIDDIIRTHLPSVYPFNMPEYFLPFDYFLVLFMIIMGLKLAGEIQQKYQMQKSINAQEQRWGNLLDKVKLLVVGLDKNGKINFLNPFFLKLTGFDKEEIIGQNYMVLIPEKDRKSLADLASKIKSPEDLPYYQNNILTSSGKQRTVSWSAVGIYDEEGNLERTISIGSDITERNNAFEEINLLKRKLEEENIILKAGLSNVPTVEKIIGKSDAIRYVLQRSMQVASTDSTVLLEGETGVGKELIADYIQQNSNRSDKPFIKINCASIPASLFESELFGHLKGAFTDASRNKKGLVEMADGGTLFLDEVGEFPLELQPKLLRFLQEGEFNPLGSESFRKVDVRIIAATNRELLKEIEEGSFRNDLYYRLYVYPITIPPLRNRVDDIPELIDLFVKRIAKKHGKAIIKISKLVNEELKKYSWPGNIRELENVIEHAVIVSNSDTIKIKDINPAIIVKGFRSTNNKEDIVSLQEAERSHILKALKLTQWQIHGETGAASILGINPNTLRSRMKKLNIVKPA